MRSGHTATETQSGDNNVYEDFKDGDVIVYYHSNFKDDNSDDNFCDFKDDNFDDHYCDFEDDNFDDYHCDFKDHNSDYYYCDDEENHRFIHQTGSPTETDSSKFSLKKL